MSITLERWSCLRLRSCRQKKWMGDFAGGPVVKNLPCNAGTVGSVPGLGRSHMLWGKACAPQLDSSRGQQKIPRDSKEIPCDEKWASGSVLHFQGKTERTYWSLDIGVRKRGIRDDPRFWAWIIVNNIQKSLHMCVCVCIYIYIYYVWLRWGLCCCVQAFSTCREWGPLSSWGAWTFVAVASFVSEHRLYGTWA